MRSGSNSAPQPTQKRRKLLSAMIQRTRGLRQLERQRLDDDLTVGSRQSDDLGATAHYAAADRPVPRSEPIGDRCRVWCRSARPPGAPELRLPAHVALRARGCPRRLRRRPVRQCSRTDGSSQHALPERTSYDANVMYARASHLCGQFLNVPCWVHSSVGVGLLSAPAAIPHRSSALHRAECDPPKHPVPAPANGAARRGHVVV